MESVVECWSLGKSGIRLSPTKCKRVNGTGWENGKEMFAPHPRHLIFNLLKPRLSCWLYGASHLNVWESIYIAWVLKFSGQRFSLLTHFSQNEKVFVWRNPVLNLISFCLFLKLFHWNKNRNYAQLGRCWGRSDSFHPGRLKKKVFTFFIRATCSAWNGRKRNFEILRQFGMRFRMLLWKQISVKFKVLKEKDSQASEIFCEGETMKFKFKFIKFQKWSFHKKKTERGIIMCSW